MLKIFTKIKLILILILFVSGCTLQKTISNKDFIVEKANIKIDGKIIKNDSLKELITFEENSKFLGIPISALIASSAKKNSDSLFKKWISKKNKREKLTNIFSEKQLFQINKYYNNFNDWKKNNGEKISLVDSSKINKSKENISLYFKNIGYLDNSVSFTVNKKPQNKASIDLNVKQGPRYYIGNIVSKIESKIIDSIYNKNKFKSFLKENEFFITENFDLERNRLYNLFRNNGVYGFQINSIVFSVKIDSTRNNYSLPVDIIINGDDYKIFKIRNINLEEIDNEPKFKFNKGFLQSKIKFRKNSVFNDSLRKSTLKSLNALDLFNFPSIQYTEANHNTLDANIILNNKKKFGLGFGFDLKQSDIEDIGIAFENRFKSRNFFKNGENLNLSASGSIGKSGNKTISQTNYDLTINFPRFLFFENYTDNLENKTTFLSFGSSNQRNIGLDRNSFKLDFNYGWTKNNKFIDFSAIQIELINNKNIENYFNIYSNSYGQLNFISSKYTSDSKYFLNGQLNIPNGINFFIEDVLNGNLIVDSDDFSLISYIDGRRQRLISNNLIIGSSFQISNNYDNRYDKKNFRQWKLKFKSSGNLASILINKNSEGKKLISDLEFSQFLKIESSFIRHWDVSDNSLFALRYFGGIAIPFGNSNNIPFSESFFGGGSNDNRAWEVYKLGPGSSGAKNEFNEANLKLALNLEYRFKMFGNFNGAIFTDIGNIWNVLDDTEEESRSFNGIKDLDELAIGSGIGIRYDSGLFIFRLDMGLKTYNPALIKKDRWFNDFSLKKAVFNIGLNYPF
ncbi:BamA/TamA family outer membrane protein [Flavobacteriales bacterium]|nr:BamA/TamA family outer membrane protein [Flavobacteriales bacterium]